MRPSDLLDGTRGGAMALTAAYIPRSCSSAPAPRRDGMFTYPDATRVPVPTFNPAFHLIYGVMFKAMREQTRIKPDTR